MSSRPATRLLDPITDEMTGEYAVYASSAMLVALTAPVAAFFEMCDHERVRPVLLTDADARLSAACATMLTDIRGYWATQGPDGVRAAGDGRLLTGFADLWRPHEAMPQRAVHSHAATSIVLDAYLRHRAEQGVRIGAAAERVAASLDVPPPTRWGVWEPLGRPWDAGAITAHLRAQMPQSGPVHALGDGATFVTQRAGRTRRGVLEHLRFSARSPVGDLHERARGLLARLHADADVEMAVVTTRTSEADGTVRPGRYPATAPLAALLGPGVTHRLGIDHAELARRHNLARLGRARTPSTLIDFGGSPDPWRRLVELGLDLDPRRVLETIGVEVPDAR